MVGKVIARLRSRRFGTFGLMGVYAVEPPTRSDWAITPMDQREIIPDHNIIFFPHVCINIFRNCYVFKKIVDYFSAVTMIDAGNIPKAVLVHVEALCVGDRVVGHQRTVELMDFIDIGVGIAMNADQFTQVCSLSFRH